MNLPQVYMCSLSWTLLPPPSPYHPSGSSQCTSLKHPVSCIEPGLATRFIHDIIHVSMPFSQIFPSSPSPTDPSFFHMSNRNWNIIQIYIICKLFWYVTIKKNLVLHLNKGKCNQSKWEIIQSRGCLILTDGLADWDKVQTFQFSKEKES